MRVITIDEDLLKRSYSHDSLDGGTRTKHMTLKQSSLIHPHLFPVQLKGQAQLDNREISLLGHRVWQGMRIMEMFGRNLE